MVLGLNRLGLALTGSLLLFACSSDENGVLTPDGAIEGLDAAGTGGSANDGSVVEEAGGGTSTDSSDAASTTTDAADGAVSDVAVDGAVCNMLVNSAAVVTPTIGVGAAPALTGGAITPGTYVETKAEVFGGDGGLPPPSRAPSRSQPQRWTKW